MLSKYEHKYEFLIQCIVQWTYYKARDEDGKAGRQALRRLTYRLTERGLYTKGHVIKEKGEIRDGFRNIVIKSYSNKVIEEKGLKSGNNRKGEGQLTRSPIAAKVTWSCNCVATSATS